MTTVSRFSMMLTAACGLLLAAPAFAAPQSVQFNGNTYYKVEGNNPAMDSGDEVCKSIGKTCIGYKSINTNTICKLFHPNAKEITSVNGSKAGFYCDGAPQTGLACAKMKNTCQVCPNCNLNEAEKCSNTIGGHFREMYVWCGAPLAQSSVSRSSRSFSRRTGVSSSKAGTARSAGPTSTPAGPDARIGLRPGYKVCEYYQTTGPSDPVRASKKLVSCGVPGLGDQFCRTSLNNPAAKALKCEDSGIVICGLPCSTPGARNDWFCSADINRPRGTMAKPLDFCPPLATSSVGGSGTKDPGQLCQHGGECKSGMCLGVIPGKEYRCSCIGSQSKWENCTTTAAPVLPATNRAPGVTCQHGGQCQSGMCLGVVPGQQYVCSCNDPKTRWQSCVR